MKKEQRKNFDKNYPLHLACGLGDNIRTGMHYISFANGYAYATDSHILVRARLTDISNFDEQDLSLLDGKFIHATNYKNILKSKGEVTITADAIIVAEENCKISYPLLTKSKIRFPECEKAMIGNGDVTLKREFGICAEFLATLSDVMNACFGIAMKWETDHMFVVKPIGRDSVDIKGVIMTKMI